MAEKTSTAEQAVQTLQGAISAAPDFNGAIDKFAGYLTNLADKYGPDMVDLILAVVRFNSIFDILFGFAFLAGAIIGFRFLRPLWAKWGEEVRTRSDDCPTFVTCISTIISAIVTMICFFISLGYLLTVWSWVGMFEPKVALAAKVLSKFIN